MKPQHGFARLITHFEKPLVAFFSAFLVYVALSTLRDSPFGVSPTAYFNYLADSFLHGQLHLRLLPLVLQDLSFYDGDYYLYWPPLPAIVLMPFVAVFGVNFSDVFFTILVASVNVGVVALLLRAAREENLVESDELTRALLILFFAFGTVQLTLAPLGQVWFTAQELGFLFVALAYLSALRLQGKMAFCVTGLLIGCAVLTRNPLLFTGIWPAWHLLRMNWNVRPRPYSSLVLFFLPLLGSGLFLLWYNFTRFGNPLELGMRYHQMNPFFVEEYLKYGAFSLHYLPKNFFYQYIRYPFPLTEETLLGGSLFLLSPVFFFLFPAIVYRYRSADTWMLLVSILTTSIPTLLFMATGWMQFGPRFTFDFTVPLLLLSAQGVGTASKRILLLFVIIAMIQYFIGTLFFIYITN